MANRQLAAQEWLKLLNRGEEWKLFPKLSTEILNSRWTIVFDRRLGPLYCYWVKFEPLELRGIGGVPLGIFPGQEQITYISKLGETITPPVLPQSTTVHRKDATFDG